MSRKLVFAISLFVLVSSLLHIRFSSVDVNASFGYPVHNIDTGLNYTSIQAAIDAPETSDGHKILVDAGIYYEHVVVNKSVSLIGEDRNTTIIDGNKTGNVVRVVTEEVCLRNFTIRNSGPPPPSPWWAQGYSGIYLGGHSHNIIRDNMITNCYGCIEIVMSHNNTIENNHLSANSNFGMRLHDSTVNIINNNRIADASTAIFLDFGANRNKVNNNTISNSGSGIGITFNCSNNTLKDNTISKSTFGISSYPCYDNIVNGNVISNCSSGVYLRGSRNIIGENIVSYSEYGGVKVDLSNFTVISGNLLTHNGKGIWVGKSDRNIIFGNTLISNDHGFDVRYCNNNTFYHNNAINNTLQAYLVETINEWDNGYPSGGNYWSDYEGVDINRDALGDAQYTIDSSNVDLYPLISIFSSFNTSLDYHVNVITNSTIEGYAYFESNNTIKMYVSSMTANQTHGFCRICIPHTLMSEPYHVTIDDAEPYYVNYTLYDDGDNRWIYFSYEHSPLEIIIIPEFPSLVILPLFMTATLLAIIVYRRKKEYNRISSNLGKTDAMTDMKFGAQRKIFAVTKSDSAHCCLGLRQFQLE